GPDAQAAVVALNKQGGLSHGKVTRCLKSLFGIPLGRGGSVHTVLRAAARCEPVYEAIRQLDNLPKFQGVVYRNDEIKYLDDYQKGAVVTRLGFTSSSAAEDSVLKGTSLEGTLKDVIMKITIKTGCDISGVSMQPQEKEVLIPPWGTYKVVERKDREDGKGFIELEEI